FTLLANNSNIYYKSLYIVRDTKKYVFLYLDMKTILIVKKDSFQTKEDYESFNKILIDNKLLKKNKNEYEFKSM
ncbi:MAG: YcxB family protein, partial [Acholeplasmatales bacterium]|nr:YcxB family protein [Acholeplasmatales bacterium]